MLIVLIFCVVMNITAIVWIDRTPQPLDDFRLSVEEERLRREHLRRALVSLNRQATADINRLYRARK